MSDWHYGSTGEHNHVWGPLERSAIAGTVHRKCQVEDCRFIQALDDDDDDRDPDDYTHAFRTPFGLPPDKGTPPVCGATLSDAYDFPNTNRPGCRDCAEIVAREKAGA